VASSALRINIHFNSIRIAPGKGWNVLFCLYGLLEAYFDRDLALGGNELVK